MHPALTHDVRVRALDVHFRIATDHRAARLLREVLADLLCQTAPDPADIRFELEPEADGHAYRLRCEPLGICERGTMHPLLGRLVSNLTAAAVARFPGLAVHAGVVAAHGRGIAFAAPSGVGKSTLTASCLRAGFDYVSDEALCLLPGGGAMAVPLPKPLALTGTSAELLGLPRRRWHAKDVVPCSALGATAVTGPVRVGHVVVLSRSPQGTSCLRPLPAALAVTTLLTMAFNAYANPTAAVEIASSTAGSIRCWALDVGDPGASASALLRLVDRQPAVI